MGSADRDARDTLPPGEVELMLVEAFERAVRVHEGDARLAHTKATLDARLAQLAELVILGEGVADAAE